MKPISLVLLFSALFLSFRAPLNAPAGGDSFCNSLRLVLKDAGQTFRNIRDEKTDDNGWTIKPPFSGWDQVALKEYQGKPVIYFNAILSPKEANAFYDHILSQLRSCLGTKGTSIPDEDVSGIVRFTNPAWTIEIGMLEDDDEEFEIIMMISNENIHASIISILDEQFGDNRNKWMQKDTVAFGSRLQNGHYRLSAKKGGNWTSVIPVPAAANLGNNYNISARLRKISGTDNYFYGMVIGLDPAKGHHHLAAITGTGGFVLANKGPQPADIIYGESSYHINKGNRENYLRLERRNNLFSLYVNDRLLGTAPAGGLYGNSFGFQLWAGNESLEIAIDQLRIEKLSEK